MNIENDPRLTAYALGELCEDERLIFELELANAGGADGALIDIQVCANRLREAYAAEPVYTMTEEQRSILLADAGALPVPVMIDEEIQHSDKVLPWVTQPVISEVDKQKIAEALKPSRWRQIVPVIGSLGVAAGVVWLAVIVMMSQWHDIAENPTVAGTEENEEPVVIRIFPAEKSKGVWAKRRVERGAHVVPPYRYGRPLTPDDESNALAVKADETGGFNDPAYEGYRRSAIPVLIGVESYETVRRCLLAGMLPPADNVGVGELVNAFEYDYPSPVEGETFAVDAEVANHPWAPNWQLLQIGVHAVEGDSITVAEDVRMEVEFNPANVALYRLVGQVDPVEQKGQDIDDPAPATVSPGQSVTALYEVLPRRVGEAAPGALTKPDELVTVRVDYKEAGAELEQTLEATVADAEQSSAWREASDDWRFAASLAGYGLLLRSDENKPLATYDLCLELARDAVGEDPDGKRKEFVEWIEKTIEIKASDRSDSKDEGAPILASPPKAPKRR